MSAPQEAPAGKHAPVPLGWCLTGHHAEPGVLEGRCPGTVALSRTGGALACVCTCHAEAKQDASAGA